MAQMRTITEAVNEYKEKDPKTGVTKSALLRWIAQGYITPIKAGRKNLINMESLETFLSGR